jgi:hypothetical protein
MGNEAHRPAETRSQTIERHTQRMMRERNITWQSFGQDVVEQYHALVPPPARDIVFAVEGDVFKRAKNNAKLLKRFLEPDATVRMPVDIEEAWVKAMPEPYLGDCRRDLAARYGLLDVPMPDLVAANPARTLADLSREFGGVLTATAEILADNQLTAADLPHIPDAITHVRKLLACVEGQLAQLEAAQQRLQGGALP